MFIKKYPQSHLLITSGNTKIIIDPGNITFQSGFTPQEFKNMDAYLITHQHADHMDPENIKEVVGEGKVFGNSDVAKKLGEFGIKVNITQNKISFKVKDLEITPIDLPHGKLPEGMGEAPPNTGFLIAGIFFHPGDGNIAPQNLTAQNLALPIAGPSISFDSALKFAGDLNSKIIIPIHFSSQRFPTNPEEFKKLAKTQGLEVRILNPGEQTEI